ncbi:MAG: FIST N-terminal domain-containing protein [Jaaginema sp. PMC 1079.18]|nr:FIST N-terminal domain-containing protein [Jaaginema sp. PMC 1080.18]MEC4850086.1 FIST N-terminal domain-containing protein [Jaaginema sp. PMC 1079.18]MEC4867567.1 FIST N-terminal domain-containing protein [Jaaginema sp. PMC 1078.18]
MFKVAVGHSNDFVSEDAIASAIAQCQETLAGSQPQAGILLAGIEFDRGVILQEVNQAFPGIELIGGTTDGEISSVLGFEQDSLVLMLFCSDRVQIRAGIGHNISQNPAIAAENAIATARFHTDEIALCIALPESLTTSAVIILDNLKQALDNKTPVFGGLTADGWQFKQTYQFYKTEVYSDALPILLFSGPMLFAHGVASGWQPIGKPGVVTKVKHNIIYEINYRPAIEFYHHYTGPRPPSSEYPLAVFEEGNEHYYLRAPSSAYDAEIGSVSFFGDIPLNARVQISETNRDRILSASQDSMRQALAQYPGENPLAALFFSCTSRRQLLGTRTQEEYRLAQKCLNQDLMSCGFYTNGEIAPLQHKSSSYFHNETFITLLLGED